jgi:hypothetical protein
MSVCMGGVGWTIVFGRSRNGMDISWQVGSRLLSIVMAALVGCYLCLCGHVAAYWECILGRLTGGNILPFCAHSQRGLLTSDLMAFRIELSVQNIGRILRIFWLLCMF